MTLYPKLEAVIERFSTYTPSKDREELLFTLVDYLVSKVKSDGFVSLNFICTHNSRRSQLAQLWGQTAADYFGITAKCFSGGVEVTAFNERAVNALETLGFHIDQKEGVNPIYSIKAGSEAKPMVAFSKTYDDIHNPQQGFAAIMTCDHADENCPIIAGAKLRLPLRYEDPKAFDDTELESGKYLERALEIGSELFFAFRKASQLLAKK